MYALTAFAAVLAGVSAAPLTARSGNSYTFYQGDGSTSAGWPAESAWVSDFETMWNANKPTMQVSCEDSFQVANNSPTELTDLSNAIQSVAKSGGLDPRFVLAIVMQESKGCVRVWSTKYSVLNPGLMQDYEGTHTCNTGVSADNGVVTNPCPTAEITGMIQDGTLGTSSGPGLKQDYSKSPATQAAQKYYQTARIYNSGSLSGSNLSAPGSTACYASDIANRLTGWTTAASKCTAS